MLGEINWCIRMQTESKILICNLEIYYLDQLNLILKLNEINLHSNPT